jgi:hypothetical protein
VRGRALTLATLVALGAGGYAAVVAEAIVPAGRAEASRAEASRAEASRVASAPSSPVRSQSPDKTAPSSPPLTTVNAGADAEGAEEDAGDTPQAEADPLVSNGLGSPTCKSAFAGELSSAGKRNCETSGFVAAGSPTGNYGIDVHIDTSVLSVSSWLPSIVQDLIVTPVWMALVWSVHALVVMLEWGFTIDLLDGATAIGLGGGLRQMQAAFTEPWLPIALASASVTALYHGLVRRRVADTLGEALLMVAMMIGGIWMITDPTGTVGVLGKWANQASLGTLAVAASGSPAAPRRASAGSLGKVFAAAIEVPWCYLEFGDVAWCREPSQLDPRLHAAALRIAAQDSAPVACTPSAAVLAPCTPTGATQAKALEHSVELLRAARSNGAIFLALPANGPARNSINDEGSLLRALCQSSEASNCRGPTAAQAEFRTSGGTWLRLLGLLPIAAGVLGMLLLLGFVTLQLLKAAAFSLLYLLLAPAMVLAPAFGESGRALFRRWALQLLGAVVSKLMFSFLLGVLLAVLAILARLSALGWWAQWLLMSAFWWGAFTHRHQAFGVAAGALGDRAAALERSRRRSIARRMTEALETPRKGIAVARMVKDRFAKPAPGVGERGRARVAGELAKARTEEQVLRTLESGRREANARAQAAPAAQRELADKREQLGRVARARGEALAGGDTRRAAELGQREARVRGEVEREQGALSAAQRAVRDGEQAQRRTGELHTRERRAAQERFLDAQAALPSSSQARPRGERRDYTALAGLAGYGRAEYERMDPRPQRAARLEIDRELALRRELGETARALVAEAVPSRVGRRERRKAARSFDDALQKRMHEASHDLPGPREQRTPIEQWQRQGRAEASAGASQRSSVMRDAHEVAARRKRQLGRDRP